MPFRNAFARFCFILEKITKKETKRFSFSLVTYLFTFIHIIILTVQNVGHLQQCKHRHRTYRYFSDIWCTTARFNPPVTLLNKPKFWHLNSGHSLYSFVNIHDNIKSQSFWSLSLGILFCQKKELFRYYYNDKLHLCKVSNLFEFPSWNFPYKLKSMTYVNI